MWLQIKCPLVSTATRILRLAERYADTCRKKEEKQGKGR
jgi:hypothetical protein